MRLQIYLIKEIVKTKQRQLRDAVMVPVLIIGLISASFIPVVQPQAALAVDNYNVTALTNKERIKHGLSPLMYDETLEQAALAKAQDMISRNYFAHYYGDTTPWDFIITAGEDDWIYAGENLAKNYTDSAALVEAWMDSQLHRENILNANYDHIGVAVMKVNLKGSTIVLTVQMFTGA